MEKLSLKKRGNFGKKYQLTTLASIFYVNITNLMQP